jgi:hypothetical protein
MKVSAGAGHRSKPGGYLDSRLTQNKQSISFLTNMKEVILIGQCASCKLVSHVLLGGSNPSYLIFKKVQGTGIIFQVFSRKRIFSRSASLQALRTGVPVQGINQMRVDVKVAY